MTTVRKFGKLKKKYPKHNFTIYFLVYPVYLYLEHFKFYRKLFYYSITDGKKAIIQLKDNATVQVILQDLRRHVKIIADFLELKPSEDLMDEIAHNCEFQTMSAFKNNHIPESMCKITDVRDKHIMYRKGDFFFFFDFIIYL